MDTGSMGPDNRRSRWYNLIPETAKGKEAAVLPKARKLIYNARGDAVVEAAILFPVMILIFSALVTLAIYMPTRSALQRATQFAATAIATECSDTWIFFDESSMSYYWADSKDALPGVYRAAFPNISGILAKGEDIVTAVENRNLSSKAGELTVDCHVVSRIVYKEIIVTATRSVALPIDLSLFGLPDSISVTVTSTAVVHNPDEFIRNLDLGIEFAESILEKFGLTDVVESIGTFGNTIASLLGLT